MADELFVTNAIQELVPLASIGGTIITGGIRGLLSKNCIILYRKAIEDMKEGVQLMELAKAKAVYRFGEVK